MRILHLISYSIYSGPMPGVLGLIKAQLAAGHEVALAYDRVRGDLDGYEEPLTREHFPIGIKILADLKMSPKASILEQLRDIKRLRSFVLASRVDIVHCHLSHDHALATLSLKKLVPIIRTVHTARVFQRRLCWPLFQATALIARSQSHHNLLEGRGKRNRISVFLAPGGVTLHSEEKSDFFPDNQTFRIANQIPEEATLVLSCAHMKDRGQKELISAIARLEQVFLVLAGDGPDYRMLQRQVRELSLTERVIFTGYIPFPELSGLYRAADIAVVAQLGNDGSARAALEAIDFAIPLLIVPDDGSLDALADSMGSSVTISNSKRPDDLGEALTTMLKHLPFLTEAAKANRISNRGAFGFQQEFYSTDQAYRSATASFGRSF